MKLLKLLLIVQTVDNNERKKKGLPTIGTYRNPWRLNPYNPLCYIFIPLYLIFAPIVVGYITLVKELPTFTNPFKWQ